MCECHRHEKDDVSAIRFLNQIDHWSILFVLVASDEKETPVATPPQFAIQKVDPTTVLIEAVVPEDEPATFEDTYDVYSKKDTTDVDEDEDWTKVKL